TPRSGRIPCGYGRPGAYHAATVCRGWRMSDTQCMECGHAGEPGHMFCPACGRQARAPRIDWHYLAEQVRHGILNLERGFLYSLCNLLLRPGRLIRDYSDGQRARQVKPLTLLLVTAAAVVLVGRLVADGDVIGSTISAGAGLAGNPELAGSPAAQEATRTLESWVNRNFALVTLLLLPLEAAGLRLVSRGVRGFTGSEAAGVSAFPPAH